jgi:hypothetical protein
MTQAVERQKSILEIVQNLTPQQQEEVLNFIEFLQFKSQKQDIDTKGKSQQKSPEELGWPPGFFEQTYGSCQDDPIVIDDDASFIYGRIRAELSAKGIIIGANDLQIAAIAIYSK